MKRLKELSMNIKYNNHLLKWSQIKDGVFRIPLEIYFYKICSNKIIEYKYGMISLYFKNNYITLWEIIHCDKTCVTVSVNDKIGLETIYDNESFLRVYDTLKNLISSYNE